MNDTPILATIPGADFAYVARFISDESVRYYLQGVQVAPLVTGGVTLVATDGHVLGAMRLQATEASATATFILSAGKDLLRACKARKSNLHTIVCRPDRVDVYENYNAEEQGTPVYTGHKPYVEGPFPDWRKVLPATVSGSRKEAPRGDGTAPTWVGLNPQLLALFAGFDGPGVSFDWNGDGAILVVNSDPRFLGVIMPMRAITTDAGILDRRAFVAGGVA